jgi:hypothetical protein
VDAAEATERVCRPTMGKASIGGCEIADIGLFEFSSREYPSYLVGVGVVAG